MNILFVAGPGRSGTTAFANYLNQHPRLLICRERYKFLQPEITPDLFSFDRILDYREGETNLPKSYHEELLAGKSPDELAWIGDKTPSYVRNLGKLHKNNPGSRFIVLYRPIEEVAESYDARSKNPEDAWLGGKNGFELGVRDWNIAMKKTRQFVEGPRDPELLIISYHDFFSRSESCIPLVSRFLEIEFDDEVRRAWEKMSRSFENRRRRKEPLSQEQARYIQENKDHETEAWVLDRIQRQWDDPELPFRSTLPAQQEHQGKTEAGTEQTTSQKAAPRGPNPQQLKQRIVTLEQSLEKEQDKTQYLEARLRSLEIQVKEMRGSTGSRLLKRLDSLRGRLLDR
ncbi:sulfotransferase family protein [Rubrobacter aplysinae]|uniref:sulfotransferase family protein n=1 Tax=Rubrobacter aplysinae TaxID=909625 RepID=UPI001364B79E|nr:sulfotransferase [Rubrobacter aplysinae]